MELVNRVNLSTSLKNPAANTNAPVSDPIPSEYRQGPWQVVEIRGYRWILLADGTHCLWGVALIPINRRVTRLTSVTDIDNRLSLNDKVTVTLTRRLPCVRCNNANRCNVLGQQEA
jgi:hypothetical protein